MIPVEVSYETLFLSIDNLSHVHGSGNPVIRRAERTQRL